MPSTLDRQRTRVNPSPNMKATQKRGAKKSGTGVSPVNAWNTKSGRDIRPTLSVNTKFWSSRSLLHPGVNVSITPFELGSVPGSVPKFGKQGRHPLASIGSGCSHGVCPPKPGLRPQLTIILDSNDRRRRRVRRRVYVGFDLYQA